MPILLVMLIYLGTWTISATPTAEVVSKLYKYNKLRILILDISYINYPDLRSESVEVQAVLVQLVGSQFGHRRSVLPGLGHPGLLQCAKCGESVQRGPAHLLRHLQHSPRQYRHGGVSVSIVVIF